MTTILLIVFGIIFYQLLIKVALQPSLNSNQYNQSKNENQNLMKMWQELQQFQQQQKQKRDTFSAPKKEKQQARPQKTGFQGGEYIDYEEL